MHGLEQKYSSVLWFIVLVASSFSYETLKGNSPKLVSHWSFENKKIFYTSSASNYTTDPKVLVEWGQTISDKIVGESCIQGDQCFDYGIAKVVITYDGNCETVNWTTTQLGELKDCVNLLGHWYGGGQQYTQPWPIEKKSRIEVPFTTADMLQGTHDMYGGVSERYWISSIGVAIRVDDTIPLFLSLIDTNEDGISDKMCFSSKYDDPFFSNPNNSDLKLTYSLCYADDIKQVYESSFNKFFSTSTEIPDERMFIDPVWSSWAEFKTDVNDTRIINLARAIVNNGFNNSQIEIDDNWETCYGDAIFNPDRFPDPAMTVDILHSMGFRVTLWIHPFINNDCDSFSYADKNGYFIKNEKNQTQITSWWQGNNNAGLIDFTNDDAVVWWTTRLEVLKQATGIDSLKFDAGEVSWMPKDYTFNLHTDYWPNGFTTAYVNAVSQFGDLIEVRVGHLTQAKAIFVRMLDKDSNWENTNELATMIPSLLHFGLIGYPFVLPDMIGGNAYLDVNPDAELFIRWAQSNTFMPTLQFSILPWNYDQSVVNLTKEVTKLHTIYATKIIELAKAYTKGEGPIMKPTWWLCPTDINCLMADQQFLVGTEILVTPIVEKGATSKTVVFPPGLWKYLGNGKVYEGPNVLTFRNLTIESNLFFTKA